MSALTKLYLFAYNSLQAIGWATAFLGISNDFISTKSLNGAYASAGKLICLLQIIGFLEVIHGALGIVPTGVLFPFMQWGGRTHFVLAIVGKIIEVQKMPSLFITFVAWSLAEARREERALVMLKLVFSLTLFGAIGLSMTLLTCYAMGLAIQGLVLGEMWLMYKALPFVKKKNLYADFFAALPFSYYDFLKVVLVCYPFLWFQLYLHLLKQRRSKLGRHHGKKNV